uniref:Beta-glucosidase-related glycosidase n=1 Tax=uncultured bacterium scaffold00090 TaxID=1132476 RepID=I6ZMC0_9BACT|nr:beta-glucosidase-related glycosidase [uncultured bacterium scaffold00090]
MTSYNEVNGVYANENKHLLREILREEWGFDGIVISDWGGSNDHVSGVAAGANLEMPAPGLDSARELIRAVQEGTLTMEELDSCVDDLLDAVLTLSKSAEGRKDSFDETAHHALARRAATESTVLLKNEDHILPLQPGAKVAVIGDFAVEPRYQGAGSSMVNPTRLDTAENMIESYGFRVAGVSRGYRRTGEADAELAKEAVELARSADVVLYFFGLDELSESEGLDRTHMRIPKNQIDLLAELSQANPAVVGILSAGSSIEMPWHVCCKGILHGYLNGQAGAGAVLDILAGKVNPSGRLAETYPIHYEDTPAYRNFPAEERNAEYRESIYVGYRYFDTNDQEVRYPFGFGLSYTTFEYSDLKVSKNGVSFLLANTGKYDGAEVAQLYIGLPDSEIFRPAKELKGFRKVFLQAGESRRVQIDFDDKSFRYWNVETDSWETEAGAYQIFIGSSVADIRLRGEVKVDRSTTTKFPYRRAELPSYYSGKICETGDAEFEKLLGHPIPDGKWSGELGMNDAICQMYYAKSRLARFIYKRLTDMKTKSEAAGKPDLNILFIYNMPFRGIAKMTGGMVSMEMAEGMLQVVNGHFFRGLGKIIKGFFRNRAANKKYEKLLAAGDES